MKRYTLKAGFLVFFAILFFCNTQVLGFEKTDYGKKQFRCAYFVGDTKKSITSLLKEVGNYKGDYLTEEMELNVKLVIKKVTGSGKKTKYKVAIKGIDQKSSYRMAIAKMYNITPFLQRFIPLEKFSREEVAEYFGNEGEDELKEGDEWSANIIVYCPTASNSDSANAERSIYLKELYTGDDLEKSSKSETSDKEVDDNAADIEEKVSWIDDFLHHPIKASVRFLMNGLAYISDAIQIRLNEIQTSGDFTAQDETLLYSYNELKKDANGEDISKNSTDETKKGIGNRDKYTKVSGYKKGGNGQANIDDENYTKDTKIPIVIGDFYNIAADKIDFLDINFLTGNTTKRDGKLVHAKDSTWNNIRNPVVEIIKISIYLSSAILLVILVWSGIGIVYNSMRSPDKEAAYKKRLEDLAKSLMMLITTILIMSLCIFFSKSMFDSISKRDDYKLPIRVNVKGAYSFSTNITGYFRYMAQAEKVEDAYKKAGYTILYFIAVILNLLLEAFMIFRIFILWFLSVQGPLLAANYAIRRNGLRRYNAWLITYLTLSVIQIGYCVVYKAMYKMIDWL